MELFMCSVLKREGYGEGSVLYIHVHSSQHYFNVCQSCTIHAKLCDDLGLLCFKNPTLSRNPSHFIQFMCDLHTYAIMFCTFIVVLLHFPWSLGLLGCSMHYQLTYEKILVENSTVHPSFSLRTGAFCWLLLILAVFSFNSDLIVGKTLVL